MALQMTCPYCKKEFPYNNGALDSEISKNGHRLADINKRLSELKYIRRTDETFKEKRRLILEADKLRLRQNELKTIRKQCDQQINNAMYVIFKSMTRETVGEQIYQEILDKSMREIEAYKLSGMMWDKYSRARYKANVTSINKL